MRGRMCKQPRCAWNDDVRCTSPSRQTGIDDEGRQVEIANISINATYAAQTLTPWYFLYQPLPCMVRETRRLFDTASDWCRTPSRVRTDALSPSQLISRCRPRPHRIRRPVHLYPTCTTSPTRRDAIHCFRLASTCSDGAPGRILHEQRSMPAE